MQVSQQRLDEFFEAVSAADEIELDSRNPFFCREMYPDPTWRDQKVLTVSKL